MFFIEVTTSSQHRTVINLANVTSVTEDTNGKAVLFFLDREDSITLNCSYDAFVRTLTYTPGITLCGRD